MKIIEGSSLKLLVKFYDSELKAVVPESMTYTIREDESGDIIRSETVTPTEVTYEVEITPTDNVMTVDGSIEKRRVEVSWIFNHGLEADVKKYIYFITEL